MLNEFRKGWGGFIAGYSIDNASIGIYPKWQEYTYGEFNRYGI